VKACLAVIDTSFYRRLACICVSSLLDLLVVVVVVVMVVSDFVFVVVGRLI
jgi:hypothetical protein